jgi:hypothetical protein
MNKELILSLLNTASTGNDLLNMLDTLTAEDVDQSVSQPTMESIEF